MSQRDLQKLNQAIILIRSLRKYEAFEILAELVKKYPEESNLWLWMAYASETSTQAQQALQRATQLNPTNPALAAAWEWYDSQFSFSRAMPTPGAGATNPTQPEFENLPDYSTKSRKLPLLQLGLALGVILLITAGLFMLTTAIMGKAHQETVPGYPGAFKAELPEFFQKMLESQAQSKNSDIKTYSATFYYINSSEQPKVIAHYSRAFKERNWKASQEFNGSMIGQKGLIKVFAEPASGQTAMLVFSPKDKSTIDLSLNQPPGDMLLVVLELTLEGKKLEDIKKLVS